MVRVGLFVPSMLNVGSTKYKSFFFGGSFMLKIKSFNSILNFIYVICFFGD